MINRDAFRRLNPTFVKGIGFASAGFIVLAAPQASLPILRFVLAGVFIVFGASNLWGHRRSADSAHGALRAALAILGGIGLLIAPAGTLRTAELIVAGYLASHCVLALYRGMGQGRTLSARIDFGRGAFYLAGAVLIVALPGVLVSLALAGLAMAAVITGLVMVAWALRHGLKEPDIANRGLAVEIFWSWLNEQDLGPERRMEIADTLYFDGPERGRKIRSYVVMLLLSVGIASLAVLQDSTAVVIGAMLVAPLMTPIMGCAAGLVAGWRGKVLASLGIVAASVVVAIGLAWVLASWIPAMVPLAMNSQVLSRASPTLLDMEIALVAGAAGAYATIDDRVSASLTGVAIAVALVPPLGVVGVALEAGQWPQALGAFLLFATNLVSIILASMVVFVLFGFSPVKKVLEARTAIAGPLSMVAMAALLIMVPLGHTGEGVLKTSERMGRAQSHVVSWLGADSALKLVRVTTLKGRVDVVLTGSGDIPSVAELESAIARSFGSPVKVTVEHFPSVIITSSDPVPDADQENGHELGAAGVSQQEAVQEEQ